MKRTKFTESQIIGILKEQDMGKKVAEICRTHSISQPTFYKWKSKFSAMDVRQLKHMKDLEQELSRYKRMYAELAHDNYILKDVIEKKR